MSEAELDDMLLMLRNVTAIGRLGEGESRDVFRVLAAKGYIITAPAKPSAAT